MSVNSTRSTTITFTGDVPSVITPVAAANASSPGQIQVQTLSAGTNTITPPAGGTTPQSVTIIPPAGNTQSMTLKGIAADTGVSLHLTDPTTIALGSAVATFVITAGGTITGIRFVWA